jgi:peptidase E
MPYLGVSAGANLACPTIRTINDMPIVQPAPLAALGLIPLGGTFGGRIIARDQTPGTCGPVTTSRCSSA